jgi:two-component system response regulator YesN
MNKREGRGIRMESLLIVRFVLPLAIVLIMSLVVGVIIYARTSRVLEDEVKAFNRLLLEQGMNVLDKRWEAIDTFIRRITEDTKVTLLQQMDDPFDSTSLYRTIEARGKLQDYYNSSELILNYYILFKKSGLVLNNEYTAKLDEFSHVLQYPGRGDNFLRELAESYHYRDVIPAGQVQLQGSSYPLLTYVRSFGFSNYSNGTVMVLIKNNEITKLFSGFQTDGGWAYIADNEGSIITTVAGPNARLPQTRLALPGASGVASQSIDGEDMIVTYTTSSYNGWTYVAAQPSKIVLQKITYIKQVTITIFLIFLVLGGLLGVYMAYRNSKPVRTILQTLAHGRMMPDDPRRSPFSLILQGVSMLMASNAELQSRMEQQLPILRSAFFERLLRGQFETAEDMEAVRAHVRIEWSGDHYLVAVLAFPDRGAGWRLQDVEYMNRKKLMIREVAQQLYPDELILHDIDEDKMAVIMQFAETTPERMQQLAEQRLEAVQQRMDQLGAASILSFGSLYTSRLDIARSFAEAQQALIRCSRDVRMVWYKELPAGRGGYYYPESTETRLMNLVRTGNEEELELLTGELHRINFVERSLPALVLKLFLFDFTASVYKIAEEIGQAAGVESAAALIGTGDTAESIELHYAQQRASLETMCRTVKQQRSERQTLWFAEVLSFVDSQYTDLQLSLSMLAEKFGVTETHLSRIFKDQTGINFIEYLENRRLEKSKQLLLTTELSVGEIAWSVGYSSSNTFGRAFKRTIGISAMAYRNAGAGRRSNN